MMTREQKVIRAKVGLLELALGNVSQACKMLGYPRDSFYRPGPDRGAGRSLGEGQNGKGGAWRVRERMPRLWECQGFCVTASVIR
jgi:hypothetical protein